MQIWNGCNALNIEGNPIKDINAKLHFWVQDQKLKDDWTSPLVLKSGELANSLLHVLSSDVMQMWAESHLKMLIYCMKFHLERQNDEFRSKAERLKPPKFDLQMDRWKMIDLPFLVLTSGGNLGNSTFACTLQWCMQMCHKLTFPISWYPFENVNLL